MEWPSILISVVSSLLGGGVISGIFTAIASMRKTERVDRVAVLLDSQQETIESLKEFQGKASARLVEADERLLKERAEADAQRDELETRYEERINAMEKRYHSKALATELRYKGMLKAVELRYQQKCKELEETYQRQIELGGEVTRLRSALDLYGIDPNTGEMRE